MGDHKVRIALDLRIRQLRFFIAAIAANKGIFPNSSTVKKRYQIRMNELERFCEWMDNGFD